MLCVCTDIVNSLNITLRIANQRQLLCLWVPSFFLFLFLNLVTTAQYMLFNSWYLKSEYDMTISVTIVLWLPSNDLFPLLPLALVLDNSERCLYDYCNIVVASLGVLDFFMDHDQQSCVGIYNHWRPFKLVAPTGLVSWKVGLMKRCECKLWSK